MGVHTGFKGADEQRIFRSSRTFEKETHGISVCWTWSMPLFCDQSLFNMAGWWYTYPSEKYESQMGWLFPIYGKIKNIPNHQPDWVDLNFETSHVRFITFFLRKLKPKKPGPQSEPIEMIRRRATHWKPTTKQETGTIYQREALHLSAVLWERVYHWSCYVMLLSWNILDT